MALFSHLVAHGRVRRVAAGDPPTSRIARPTRRDSRALTSRFAQLTPEKLAAVLRNADIGRTEDWADLCDRMVQIDAEVRAAIVTRYAAISGSRWEVEPGTPTGDPERDRWSGDAVELVARQLSEMHCEDPILGGSGGFDQMTHDALDGIGKGFSALEIDWQWIDETWVAAELTWIHQRRFRFSDTWELLLVDDGETLHTPGVPLERDRWVVHMPRDLSGYPGQTGALRPVAWPYLFKRWGQQFWVSGAEAFSWPFLFAKVPRDAPLEVRQKALLGLEQLSADHRAVIEDPTAFELLETTVKDGGTWKDLHNAMNAEIVVALLGMTDATQASRVGAYAAVETRKGMNVDARIAHDERGVRETMTTQLAARILRFNQHRFGGKLPPTPRVRRVVAHTSTEVQLSDADKSQLATIVEKVATGAIPRDAGVELITASFPTISAERAEKILGSAGRTAPAPEPAPKENAA